LEIDVVLLFMLQTMTFVQAPLVRTSALAGLSVRPAFTE